MKRTRDTNKGVRFQVREDGAKMVILGEMVTLYINSRDFVT